MGLKFDTAGTFVKVLEQREGIDLIFNRGWHPGGKFEYRDGKHIDTIALSAVPTAITTAFKSAYPTDTLLYVQITPDSKYVLLNKNNGLYATVYTAIATFVKRLNIDRTNVSRANIAQADLPTTVQSYLTTIYPGYVFDKAFTLKQNSTSVGYVAIITANNTKYAVKFNANGTFAGVATLH